MSVNDRPAGDENDRNETPITQDSTAIGGKPDVSVDNPSAGTSEDLVHAALADAQRLARTGARRARGGARRRRNRHDAEGARGGYSGPGPDDTDPQPVGAVLSGYVDDRGWTRPLADARVFADWPALVGEEIAAHCTPVSLREGHLRISAESTAWATQLRLLAARLLARLADELGPQTVRQVSVTGPTAPSWRHGPRSVPGARGPRDTYG